MTETKTRITCETRDSEERHISLSLLCRRGFNLIAVVVHQLRWRWRFKEFGWRSRLEKCDMLTNPKMISIGRKVRIWKGSQIEALGDKNGKSPKIIIGDGTGIHMNFHCGAAESVTIGKNVLIASRVYITDHDHKFDDPKIPPRRCSELISKPVVIEDGVWLGEGCVILKGVTVHRRAVVGANAVVTKDVPPFTVVGGVPARIIKHIFPEQIDR